MRHLISWQLLSLLFFAITAGALDNSNQSSQSPSSPPADSATPPDTGAATTPPATSAPSVTVTGKAPPLPKLAPDKFIDCYGMYKNTEPEVMDWAATEICQAELARDTRIVIDKCINRDGQNAPAMSIYVDQKNFSGALADFSEALRLRPKTATLWSERGYVSLLQRDYQSALRDEAEAIRLDPKLARAYFLRGAAFGDLGDSPSAVTDLVTAVNLDPSLDHYITSEGKNASIALPRL